MDLNEPSAKYLAQAGYKRTDIGLLPMEWSVEGLAACWTVTDCKHVTATFTSTGYPVASIREVQSRFVDLSQAKRTTDHFYRLLIGGGRKPVSGDLIFSRNATVGAVAQVCEWHPPFALGQDVCLLRKRTDEPSTAFLHAVFGSPMMARQLQDAMVGSTFKRVNVMQIRNLTVPMPPPKEQHEIAQVITDSDALIESLEQLLAKKRQIKQGAMQELLTGQRRLPGFSDEWTASALGSLGFVYGGLTGKSKKDFGHGSAFYIPFMNVMSSVVIDPAWLERVDIQPNETQNDVKQGDLLFNGSSETPEEVGMCSVLHHSVSNLFLNSFCFGFRFHPGAQADGNFLAYWFRSAIGRATMSVLAQGATRYNIAKSAFVRLSLNLPKREEQTAIATILSDMDTEITALEARLTKARHLKQGMAQALLTGRIRLQVPDAG